MARRTLTAETIGRIKPSQARREIADAVVPGLYLVVQPSGARSFAVRTRIAGKPVKITLGSWPVVDLAKARDFARAKLAAVAEGVDPRRADKEVQQASRRTVAAVCEDWLRRDQAENRGVATVRRIMAREVLPHTGDLPIEAVRKRDLIAVIDRVVDRAPVRANRVLAHTKRLFGWAAARDLIEANPAASIEKPTAERPRDRVLSDAELAAIWRAAEHVGGAYAAGIRLLILTGARVAEVFEAKWSEIDGDALRLPAVRSKSKEVRVIWLSRAAQEIIGALPRYAGCDWLLTVSGRLPFRAFGASKVRLDAALADEMAVAPWRVHDIRRTVATGLQRLGVRLEAIEAVLGHIAGSRGGIVGVYQRHKFEAEAAAAVRRWGEQVRRIVEGSTAKVIDLRRT